MTLLNELLTQDTNTKALPLVEALEEAVRTMNVASKGKLIKNGVKNAADFFKANPALTTGAAVLAINALGNYEKNKRNTIHLHAKSAYEKKMMTSIVDALGKDGLFKVQRIKFENGGKTWVLRRKV